MPRKTIPITISLQPDNYEYLKNKIASAIINEALRDHKNKRVNPEEQIKEIKEKKRELAKQIHQLNDEVEKLFERLNDSQKQD